MVARRASASRFPTSNQLSLQVGSCRPKASGTGTLLEKLLERADVLTPVW